MRTRYLSSYQIIQGAVGDAPDQSGNGLGRGLLTDPNANFQAGSQYGFRVVVQGPVRPGGIFYASPAERVGYPLVVELTAADGGTRYQVVDSPRWMPVPAFTGLRVLPNYEAGLQGSVVGAPGYIAADLVLHLADNAGEVEQDVSTPPRLLTIPISGAPQVMSQAAPVLGTDGLALAPNLKAVRLVVEGGTPTVTKWVLHKSGWRVAGQIVTSLNELVFDEEVLVPNGRIYWQSSAPGISYEAAFTYEVG